MAEEPGKQEEDRSTSVSPLKLTPLAGVHREQGARMVPFAGYNMPVQYAEGVMKEHLHTRKAAGLFDVSHMGQLRLRGSGLAEALEKLVPLDLRGLAVNHQCYGLLTNEQGGIRDDFIICRWGEDDFFMVVNAACKEADIAHLKAQLPGFEVEELTARALLALQGPLAVDVLTSLLPEVAELTFMHGLHGRLAGAEVYITRSGYTGEDGFEISLPGTEAAGLARTLLAFEGVVLIGLGARDSLRLEAGLCLYGHDIDATISPVEAGLSWSISPCRRRGGSGEGGFPGADSILAQLADGPTRRRVGLAIEGRVPVREGAELQTLQGEKIGQVCSGGFGPSLQAPVAMGYVRTDVSAIGTALQAVVRGKPRPLSVCKLPFVPHRYYRG